MSLGSEGTDPPRSKEAMDSDTEEIAQRVRIISSAPDASPDDETNKRGVRLPWLRDVFFGNTLALAVTPSSAVRVAKFAGRSVLEMVKPTTNGYSHKAIVWARGDREGS